MNLLNVDEDTLKPLNYVDSKYPRGDNLSMQKKTIGEKIFAVRVAIGKQHGKKRLSQQEFAERIGIAQNTLSQIEAGKKRATEHLLTSIIYHYGLHPEYFTAPDAPMFAGHCPKCMDVQAINVANSSIIPVGSQVVILENDIYGGKIRKGDCVVYSPEAEFGDNCLVLAQTPTGYEVLTGYNARTTEYVILGKITSIWRKRRIP